MGNHPPQCWNGCGLVESVLVRFRRRSRNVVGKKRRLVKHKGISVGSFWRCRSSRRPAGDLNSLDVSQTNCFQVAEKNYAACGTFCSVFLAATLSRHSRTACASTGGWYGLARKREFSG